MKSPITGKEMTLKRELASLDFRKESFEYFSHYYFCEESGEQFASTELDELNLLQVYNQYRDKFNLPFPAEIQEIREKYGLSGAKMSEILGFGTNSYRNYENGEVPSSSNGRLIQLVRDPSKFKAILLLCESIENSDREKIVKRVDALIGEERENSFSIGMESYLLGSSLPDATTGFVKPNFLKLTEMVKFFAERIQPWKTVLNKLLFYSDFWAYKSRCYSMSGVRYRAIGMGPVPNNYDSIYEFMANEQKLNIVNVQFSEGIFGNRFEKLKGVEFNPELFDSEEIEILEKVCAQFLDMKTNEVIDYSHEEIGWKENEKDRNLIDYKYAFAMKFDKQ